MHLKVWALEMRHPIRKSRRFIRKVILKKEISSLQAQGRILYSGNNDRPEIALTFDDGPDPCYTPQILAILQRYNAKATFFCLGRHVAAYPHLTREIYEAGHVIGNHTWSHPDLALLGASNILSELTRTSDAIQEIIGVRPTFFRPPYGTFSRQVFAQATHLDIKIVIWSHDTADWTNPGVDFIIQRSVDQVGGGAIILMHDGEVDPVQTVEALPIVLERLRDRGFQFVTLQQIVDNLDRVKMVKRVE